MPHADNTDTICELACKGVVVFKWKRSGVRSELFKRERPDPNRLASTLAESLVNDVAPIETKSDVADMKPSMERLLIDSVSTVWTGFNNVDDKPQLEIPTISEGGPEQANRLTVKSGPECSRLRAVDGKPAREMLTANEGISW